MVDARGEVYVMDWGLAKRLAPASDPGEVGRTRLGAVLGMLSYMAPEQVRGESREAGRGADVFALGVMLYEVLTGRNPFASEDGGLAMEGVLFHQPEPPRRLNPRVPRPLAAVCMKALEKDPFRRYASARELVDDIRRYRELLPVSAYPPGPVERAYAWLRRHPVAAGALATLVAAVALAAGWGARCRGRWSGPWSPGPTSGWTGRGPGGPAGSRRSSPRSSGSRGRRRRTSGSGSGPRWSTSRPRREAQLRFAHALAVGVLGFTVFSPEERAEKLLKQEMLGNIEHELRSGSPERAEVLIRFALLTSQGANALRLSGEEKAELEKRLAELEQAPTPGPPRASATLP